MTVIRHPNNQGVTLQQWRKTAAGGETSLTGTDDFSAALAYTVGAEEVFINGVLIERGVDYTATSGTGITLTNALVAGDLATVQSATSFNVANAIPRATVTAKGDLITATGASTVTNLAVGADGSTLVANSSASTGMSWTTYGSPNFVINGGMDCWQRGTSFASSGNLHNFAADRFAFFRTSAGSGMTVTRQSSGLTGFNYCLRAQRNSGDTNTEGMIVLGNTIETANAIYLAGKQITISFYARAGANFSSSSNTVTLALFSGTGTDEFGFGAFTNQATVATGSYNLTTSWQRFTATGTMASNATELSFYFSSVSSSGTAGTNDYYDITGIQLEAGSIATPFRRAGGTVQGELAACQRYYWRSSSGVAYAEYAWGVATSSTQVNLRTIAPVPMRIVPTSMDYNQLQCGDEVNSAGLLTGLTMSGGGSTNTIMNMTASQSSGFTQYRPYFLFGTSNTGNYLGFSAEL